MRNGERQFQVNKMYVPQIKEKLNRHAALKNQVSTAYS